MDKLISACTDGAPCMVESEKRFVALRKPENKPILSVHCILQHAVFCAQMYGEVMLLMIKSQLLFLKLWMITSSKLWMKLEIIIHPDLLIHSNVHQVPRRKVLNHFAACLSKAWTFLEMKGINHLELTSGGSLLNQLSVKRQGNGNTVLSFLQAGYVYENKLKPFRDTETGRLLHSERQTI